MQKMKSIFGRLCGAMLVSAAVLVFATGQASAAQSISSTLFLGELNQWSDNNGETQSIDIDFDGFLFTPGDALRGTTDIQTVEDQSGLGGTIDYGTATVNELTAVFVIEVVSATIVSDADGSCLGSPTCAGGVLNGDETADYVFGPSAAFASEFSLTPGTMFAFFEDTSPDFDRTLDTVGAIEATATDGTLVLELGIYGLDADELWVASGAPVDVTLGKLAPLVTILGTFNMQLSIGFNALFGDFNQVIAGCTFFFSPTAPCAGDGLIDFNASGSVTGTLGSTTAYDIFSNVDFTFRPVPEPGTLALFGLGLLGLGFMARRRRLS